MWEPLPPETLQKKRETIEQVEMVQRRAARFATGRYHNTSSVTDMLEHLEWPRLQQRRQNARLTMMYKVIRGLVALPSDEYLIPADSRTRHRSILSTKYIPHA